jgi:tetratricopeptide (TPR) repeat protein|tara:strand:- start:355 stop:1746 length:1392 start_codon:yes stop_codon:yes gene_type:complete
MTIIKNISLAVIMLLPTIGFAQLEDDIKYGDTKEQRRDCLEALNIYKSFKKQKNYSEAYQQWKKACDVCPPTVQENLYADGVIFIKAEIKTAKADGDEVRATVMIDSLMWAYDMRMDYFPSTQRKPNNRCHILGNKAASVYKYNKSDPETAFLLFKEALDCLGAKSSASILSNYYVTAFYSMKAINKTDKVEGAIRKTAMLTDYLMLMDYANTAIASTEKEKTIKSYESAKANIERSFVAIAKCDEMVPVLQASIDANPDDFELKKNVLSLLVKRECTENDLFLPIATAVYENEPSAEAAYAIGMGYAKISNFSMSYKYMEEAVRNCEGCDDQMKYLLKTGQIASRLKKSSAARRYARQVLALDPNSAEAYMLIGDAIAGASASCDDGALGARAVYWVAHDYYSKAKRMNPALANKASAKMRNMEKQFPTIEEIFNFGLQAGSSFTVKSSCVCLGETTTIRVR